MKKVTTLWVLMMLLLTSIVMAAPIKTIHFATEATYPPFEFINESGEIKGFDIDIANALCLQMQVQCTFKNQPFNSLIPSLELGKFDALISALGVTPERQKQVAFSNTYYQPSGSFVAPTLKHYKIADLTGKIVGVQGGSTFETYMKDKYASKMTIKTYASIQDAFLDLASGRIDTVLADTPIVKAWLKQSDNNSKYSIVDQPIVDDQYFGSGYGIAMRKDNTDLLHAINKALADIKANGMYAKIVNKYFGN